MKALLPAVLALSAVCALSQEQPRFETASVKRIERGVIHNSLGPGAVILRGDPLRVILAEAFQMKGYQILGPAWLDDDCFEIVAKMPEGATSDQIPAMLRALLVERFQLAFHKDNRPRPAFALVIDKGGPKFKEVSANFRRIGSRPGLVFFRAAANAQGFKGELSMATVAKYLSGHLDRPVQDFTKLTGIYEIDLSWAPDPTIDRQSAGSFSAATAAPGDATPYVPDPPTANLFTALRETLGLKLESRNEPVEMLVIDHVERIPTGN